MYRTFAKPLGYAGDYEMVNMMLRDPWEGSTLFAKVLNVFFLSTPPVVAHRNRVKYLVDMLINEALRVQRCGRKELRVFNLGCGPAKEVVDFIARSDLSQHADFTLLDLSEEALSYARQTLEEEKQKQHRTTTIQTLKKSIGQFIKETAKPGFRSLVGAYDVVYCAGLFDYLPDHVCRKLMEIGRGMLAPGGLMMCSNVAGAHPSRGWMEYAVDWHLVYRDSQDMAKLAPAGAGPEDAVVKVEETGVNYLLEVRKPLDG
jgi:extracellular factor (EF) 3-hydroxypalmitic acid methyl ester biosynthesis protein